MIFGEKNEISLNEPVDWVYLSELARKQNLLPLFFEIANRFEDYVKSDGYAKDQLDTFAMVAAQIRRSSAFLDVYGAITAKGIHPIVMKGIVCRQLYGELGEHRLSVESTCPIIPGRNLQPDIIRVWESGEGKEIG